MSNSIREPEPSGSLSHAMQCVTGQAKRENVVPSPQSAPFAMQHCTSTCWVGFFLCCGKAGGGCWMVAIGSAWGCLPGVLRAPLYPAEWGDFPSLGDSLPIVGHRTGTRSGLVPPGALAWADSAFKVNSGVWTDCCFEGSFTFLTACGSACPLISLHPLHHSWISPALFLLFLPSRY